MEEGHKRVLENLQNLILEKEEAQRQHDEDKEKIKEGTRCQNVRQHKRLEMKVEALQRRITELKHKEDLTPKVSALENTVKEKSSHCNQKHGDSCLKKGQM